MLNQQLETLFIATSNPGKLRDFASAQLPAGASVLPLPGIDRIAPPAETENSFEGNACLKAIAYSRQASGLLVLADDSGLEVDALCGAPGVNSARYAQQAAFPNPRQLPADPLNNQFLLHQMAAVPADHRTARYRCVLAAAKDGALLTSQDTGKPILGRGCIEGLLLIGERGERGFGYDPLFLIPEMNLTMAEISTTERLKRSHRALALNHFLSLLLTTV